MARVQWLVRGNVREGVSERLLDALAIGSAECAERVRAVGMAAGLGRETKGKRELRRRVSLTSYFKRGIGETSQHST